jgi:methylated-DNA-[protein]-cysteine S-methyltransferase
MQISVDVEDQEVHKKRFYTREDFAPSRSKKKYLSNFQEIRWIREYLVKEAKSNKKVMRLINHEGPEKIISKFKSKLMKVRPEKFQRISLNTFAGLINIYFENNDLKRIAFNKKDDTLDEIISEYTEYSEKSDEKIRPEYIINTEYIESPDQIDTVMATDPLLAGKPALLYIKKYLKAVPIQDSIEFTAYITEVIAKSGSSIFQKKVWQTLLTIPFGKTLTYGEIAQKMGMPNSARAVGAACGKNPFPILVPCHRVVAQKSLGGFSSGLKIKKKLLEFEKNNS